MILSTSNDAPAKRDVCIPFDNHSGNPPHLRKDALKRIQRRRECREQMNVWKGTLLKGDEPTPSGVQSDSSAPHLRGDALERVNRRRETEEIIRRYQGVILKEDVDNIFVDNTTPRTNEKRFAIYAGKLLPVVPGYISSTVSRGKEATDNINSVMARKVKVSNILCNLP